MNGMNGREETVYVSLELEMGWKARVMCWYRLSMGSALGFENPRLKEKCRLLDRKIEKLGSNKFLLKSFGGSASAQQHE